VIDSLSLTLGTDAGSITKFDILRKKRNISDYERADTISASDVEEMRSLAEKLRVDFEAWIQNNHPQLKPRFCALVIEAEMGSSQTYFKVAGDCWSTRVWVGRARLEKFPGTNSCVALMRVKRVFRVLFL
jgi:hypothetical protein